MDSSHLISLSGGVFVTRRGRLTETNRSNLTDLRSNRIWCSLQISLCTGKALWPPRRLALYQGNLFGSLVPEGLRVAAAASRKAPLEPIRLGTRRPRRRLEAISLSALPRSRGGVARRGGAARAAPTCRCTVHPPPAIRLHGPPPRTPRTSLPEPPGQRGGSPHLRSLSGAGASQRSCE